MTPSITCVIPCHNHAGWVAGALASFCSQDYPSKRAVVIDDGSSDGSHQVVLDLLQKVAVSSAAVPSACLGTYMGVEVLLFRFDEAKGPSFARNWGVKASWDGTDAFMFLDSDDEYLPGKVSRSVAKWAKDPASIGAVYTDYDTVDQGGVAVREYKEPFSHERLFWECLANMDSLVSKSALEACGLFDESLRVCEDYDLWHRVAEKFLIVHVPEVLLRIRWGGHNSSSTVQKSVWESCRRRVFEKAEGRAAAAARR